MERILEFKEKPKGPELESMKVDTAELGLTPEEAALRPYLASMGIYVFSRETLFDLLSSNHRRQILAKKLFQRHCHGEIDCKAFI